MLDSGYIIGFRKFNSKTGNPCLVVSVVCSLSPAEISKGSVGQKCVDVFLDPVKFDFLCRTESVGKVVKITKDINNVVDEVEII